MCPRNLQGIANNATRSQRGVGDVVLCGEGRGKSGREASLAWLASKFHLSHAAVEVNTVNIHERFRFGKLGVKGPRSFYFLLCLGGADMTLMFCYGVYRSLLWKICVCSMQLYFRRYPSIIKKVYQFQVLMSFAVECRVVKALGILNEFLEFNTNYKGRFLIKQGISKH